ncbi:hypothetical protein JK386_00530 [Nocardioides sp. zg-536]|uniref:Mannosyltransferase n=1 Tax=Nocardioides faecalis TaxID=2803858 RepID=A0A938Y343_9ACTN|nr:capsular polysaccharide synthesis protein [Nocardioides faecalis]MBM9458384.1 hypothetical protein [Nocardioides faecalis]QVI58403.1 hypothetical protein KG111_15610 [Nocardioides faecalis]
MTIETRVGLRADGPINRTVFILWFQGEAAAPRLVRRCIDSWRTQNPTWDVVVLDRNSLSEYVELPAWCSSKLGAAHLSDLVRLRLLEAHGGVWADATTYCSWPLDSWLPGAYAGGFFAFAWPDPGYELSNWFLAADPGEPLLTNTRELLEAYWAEMPEREPGRIRILLGKILVRLLRRSSKTTSLWFSFPVRRVLKVYPYFAFHYAFAAAVGWDVQLRNRWNSVVKISSDGPHSLQRYGLDRRVDEVMMNELSDPSVPLYKLTYKGTDHLIDDSSSALGCLLSVSRDQSSA